MSNPTPILVVDRNRKFLDKCDEILSSANHKMIAAQDAAEAREMLAYHKPQVVFVNPRISGENGYQLCRYIKDEIDAKTPVVLMFSRGEEGTTNLMLESGADNYLSRPIKRQELLFCVRDMLKIRQLNHEIERLKDELARALHNAPDDTRNLFFSFDVFKKLLYVEIQRAKRYETPISTLLISLDGLDAIQAAHGPEMLTKLREAVSIAIRRSIRDIDLPAAFRQGNILIVMPNTDENGIRVVADRIQQRLRRSTYKGDGFVLRPTLSIGATTSSSGRNLSFSQMILTATLALKEAQRAGGDRVVFA